MMMVAEACCDRGAARLPDIRRSTGNLMTVLIGSSARELAAIAGPPSRTQLSMALPFVVCGLSHSESLVATRSRKVHPRADGQQMPAREYPLSVPDRRGTMWHCGSVPRRGRQA